MGIDALLEGCLADVEWEGLGEGSAIGYGAVGADTVVGEGGLEIRQWHILKDSSARDLPNRTDSETQLHHRFVGRCSAEHGTS